jgi:hypothetical protein
MTQLKIYHDIPDESGHMAYTRDSWTIPEDGTEIWCTGWKRGQTIKPHGDGAHVIIGLTVYHVDEIMGILTRWEDEGCSWGIDGVKMVREQKRGGYWEKTNH